MSLKFRSICFGLALLGIGAAPSAAQEPGFLLQILGECRADAADFCDDVRPGEGRIAACLYAHMDSLRPACRQGVAMGAAIRACAWDAKTFCDDVRPGGGRIAACLSAVRERLSPKCRSVVAFWSEAGGGRYEQEDRDLLK
jgi:hypothetical protein